MMFQGTDLSQLNTSKRFRWSAEVVCFLVLFVGFVLQGAWPVPDVNEAHYVSKMIAFWNRKWILNDPFLESADAHPIFFAIFGWPSLFLEAEVFTWIARLAGWFLVTLGWYVFARQVLPSRWQAVFSGLLFACLQERFNMAGEWVIGGSEAKVPAYGFVFLGLAAAVRERWNLAFIGWGVASAFHVLVGGWAFLIGFITWWACAEGKETLSRLVPGLVVGGGLALLGLVPALRLNWGVDFQTSMLAAQIYLYRLGHHLSFFRLPASAVDKFLLLVFVWFLLEYLAARYPREKVFRSVVAGALGLALLGWIFSYLEWFRADVASLILRFYWFRLADVMLPAGIAIVGTRLLQWETRANDQFSRVYRVAVIAVVGLHFASYGYLRMTARIPRADENQVEDYTAWRDLCRFVRESGQIPPGSRFITPRTSYTFRWYARQADLVNWKDIPQDAASIVRWWNTLCEVHAYRDATGRLRWLPSVAHAGTEAVRAVAKRYNANYVIAPIWPPLDLPVVYKNSTYVLYQVP